MIDFVTRMEGRPPNWKRDPIEQRRILRHPRFALQGEVVTRPARVEQTIDSYIACQHSRSIFAPGVMGAQLASEFDAALREVLLPHADGDQLVYECRTKLEWGSVLPDG